MKKIFITLLLIIGMVITFSSTPINTANTTDDVPEPQAKPFSQKDVM